MESGIEQPNRKLAKEGGRKIDKMEPRDLADLLLDTHEPDSDYVFYFENLVNPLTPGETTSIIASEIQRMIRARSDSANCQFKSCDIVYGGRIYKVDQATVLLTDLAHYPEPLCIYHRMSQGALGPFAQMVGIGGSILYVSLEEGSHRKRGLIRKWLTKDNIVDMAYEAIGGSKNFFRISAGRNLFATWKYRPVK